MTRSMPSAGVSFAVLCAGGSLEVQVLVHWGARRSGVAVGAGSVRLDDGVARGAG